MSLLHQNKNNKLYLLLAICLVVVLIMWLYTLKLNLVRETKSEPGFKNMFGELGNLLTELPSSPDMIKDKSKTMSEFLEQVKERLKNKEIEKLRD